MKWNFKYAKGKLLRNSIAYKDQVNILNWITNMLSIAFY